MSAHLGDRLNRYRRYAGLTQTELARRSRVSASLIRQLEQGVRDTTRLETAHRLARALGITTSTLIAEHRDAAPDEPAGSSWDQWRRALDNPQMVDEVPTVGAVRSGLARMARSYTAGEYQVIMDLMPTLLVDAQALHEAAGAHGQAQALYADALTMTGRVMTQHRQFDLAEQALDAAAHVSPDQTHTVNTINTRCWLLLRRGRLEECRELAERTADDTEPRITRATSEELSAWGWMLIKVAACGVRDNRPDDADDAMKAATAAAAMLGRPEATSVVTVTPYSSALVATQRAEHAVVRDRPDVALRITEAMDASGHRTSSGNHRRHLVNKALAQVQLKKYSAATDTLMGLDVAAPLWLEQQQSARTVVELIVKRRRTLSPEMRHLASRLVP